MAQNERHSSVLVANGGDTDRARHYLYEKWLDMRIVMQKSLEACNQMPDMVDAAGNDANLEGEVEETRSALRELYRNLLQLREVDGDAFEYDDADDDELLSHSKELDDSRDGMEQWNNKMALSRGNIKEKDLKVLNQGISAQLEHAEKEIPAMAERAVVEGLSAETYDDKTFYQQLLRDVTSSADETATDGVQFGMTLNWLRQRKDKKKKKIVEKRASKRRILKFDVHPKLTNFMAPAPLDIPPMADTLFSCLFDNGQQSTAQEVVRLTDKDMEILM